MNIKQALNWSNQQLKNKKIRSSVLDAEVVLAHVLKTTKEKLYVQPEQKLNSIQLTAYRKLIKRRAKHEPAAFLIGHKEFYGLDFLINKKILIPRPETELMVEEVLKQIHDTKYKLRNIIIDVGTGSGCIIISLAKLLTTHYLLQTKFFATDISPAALKLAKQNARRHGVEKQIKFLRGNLLEPVIRKIPLIPPLQKGDVRGISNNSQSQNSQFRNLIITANLPYLPTSEWRHTPPDVKKYEPRLALDGGPDGLKYYCQLFQQVQKSKFYILYSSFCILLEICPHQSTVVKTLVHKYFPKARVQIKKDLSGHKRLTIITIKHSY